MNFLFPMIWLIGITSSVDEMIMGFQDKHKEKLRITYKSKGGGFQCEALCQDKFMYQCYMKNDPAPPKYQHQGLSPLHSRMMALFIKSTYYISYWYRMMT